MRRKREKSKPCVMSNFADHAYYCYKEKVMGKEEKGEKKREEKKFFMVISGGTLFCRLQSKEPEKDSG